MKSQTRTKKCKECETPYEMIRLDQLFCCRKCRNTYNNRNYRVENSNTKTIDAILHANRKILEQLGEGIVKKDELLKLGFNFRFITEVFHENKCTYFGCYNYCYVFIGNNKGNNQIKVQIFNR